MANIFKLRGKKKNAEYLALYGTQSIKLPQIDNSVEFVDAEEG